MQTAINFPKRCAAFSRWGRPVPETPEVFPPQSWVVGYLAGYSATANTDNGVNPADALPNCAVFWWIEVNHPSL